jgi:hypothetical protein
MLLFLEPIDKGRFHLHHLKYIYSFSFREGHLRSHQVSASLLDNAAYLTARSRQHSRIDMDNTPLKKLKGITVLEFGDDIVARHLENLLVSGHINHTFSSLIKTESPKERSSN